MYTTVYCLMGGQNKTVLCICCTDGWKIKRGMLVPYGHALKVTILKPEMRLGHCLGRFFPPEIKDAPFLLHETMAFGNLSSTQSSVFIILCAKEILQTQIYVMTTHIN